MSSPIIKQQSEAPPSIHLLRHLPRRRDFDWRGLDPVAVQSAQNLPPYLILGQLDEASFQRSDEGWSARWQGTEIDTWFDLAYDAGRRQWVAEDRWRGINGCNAIYNTRIPLPVMIGQAMYGAHPRKWDSEAKRLLEATYQLKVAGQQENAPSFCGIPDGPLRTIAFPLAVSELRNFRDRLSRYLEHWQAPYPVAAEAKLAYQAVSWQEGEATDWQSTTQPDVAFQQSVKETGLLPFGFPRRSAIPGKPAAWTQTRELYLVFLSLPLAGLTDLLYRLSSSEGPIRQVGDPALRFEWRPIVLQAAQEHLAEDLTLSDEASTTLVYLRFKPLSQWGKGVTVDKLIDGIQNAEDDLTRAEATSAGIVAEVERVAEQMSSEEQA